MYTFLEETTRDIIGLKLSGEVDADELDVIIKQLNLSIRQQGKINMLVIFEDFEGWKMNTAWMLTRFFAKNMGSISRIALIGEGANRLEELLPEVFRVDVQTYNDKDKALNWLGDDKDHWTVDPVHFKGEVRQPKDMRILIVGAGVAGLTLAAMLQQRDMNPVVVEDAKEFGKIGYVIILMSAGGRILKGLGVHDQLHEHGVLVHNYDISDKNGDVMRSHEVNTTFSPLYGDSFSIYRPDLVSVIKGGMKDDSVIRMGTTVDAIEQTDEEALVTFSDGTQEAFDLVVGADGLHSKVRELTFGEVDMIYSGLHGWAWWGEKNEEFDHRALEHWGDDGGAFGLYPTEDRLCIVGVISTEEGQEEDASDRKARIREHFKDWGPWVQYGLDELETMDNDEIFHDDFYYGDQKHWYRGRVVLAGDSVHAFSPISGLGASMAMESAAVLAEELCYVDSRYIDQALRKYEERRKMRVSLLRNQARAFSEAVTADSDALAGIRNMAVRYVADGPLHHFLARIPYEPV